LWAVGTLLALLTIALLVGLLVVNLEAVKWEDLSRERREQVALFIGIAVGVTTLFVLLAIGGASLGWTGFADKTLWDWLQLLSALAIPVVLAAAGLWFTAQQDTRQQKIEDRRAQQAQKIENQRAEAERKLAEQQTQDEALQAYLDQMSQLMLDRKLLEAEPGDPVYTLAQARTSTVILRLDAEHNESVTRFLIDSGLAGSSDASAGLLRKITLSHAKLSDAYLPNADLSGAELNGADLSGANLTDTDLSRANLSNANLSFAHLPNADLSRADLSSANLHGAYLPIADLSDAILYDADLSPAILSGADLSDAKLTDTDLSSTDLSPSILNGSPVILSGADLSGAVLRDAFGVTDAQLEQAKTLAGATMPNGKKYEEWLKSKGRAEDG